MNGVGTAVPATRETPDQFRAVVDGNLNGSYWMAQACGRVMQPGSSIVNISSILGLTTAGLPQAAYAASKGGVSQLTKALANEWAPKGIQVNAIAPGYFATTNTEALQADETRNRQILERIPAAHWGQPQDLAGAALYLSSPASNYVTGTVLTVDGGWMGR